MPMSQLSPARRALLIAVLTATAASGVLPKPAPPHAVMAWRHGATRMARVPVSTSAKVADDHEALRSQITRFQDEWRGLWEKARVAQDGRLQLPLADTLDPTNAALRRFWALQCYVRTPYSAPAVLNVPVFRRPVVATPDRGPVCPMWFPPSGKEPANEAESIDFALLVADRRRARQLRDGLIGALEQAHAKAPADAWIAGQRVRFVYDQGDPLQTVRAARACRGDAGWCAMLLGLAYAQADSVLDAETSFLQGEAQGALPLDSGGMACAAHHTRALIALADRDAYDRAMCATEAATSAPTAVEKLWWLADPLWSVAGNERYVAHQARRTLIALRSV
jgi:hypothetical protein